MNRRLAVVFSSLLLVSPLAARADSVWIGETSKKPIEIRDVKVIDIKDGALVYALGSSQQTKPLSSIQQIKLDGDPAFSAAEDSYINGKFGPAADAYLQAAKTATKPVVQIRSALRLIDVAAKADKPELAVTGFTLLVRLNPALAPKEKPPVANLKGPQLDSAIADVSGALAQPKLTDAQRSTLLALSLTLYRAKGDTAGVTSTLSELSKLGSLAPEDMAILKLASAQSALANRDFTQAIQIIQQNRTLFTDSNAQVDALFTIAQALDGQAGDKGDANTMKDVALAYVRCATFAKDSPGQPHVSESLLRAAQIQEQLGEPKSALDLYTQISKEFPTAPAANEARASIQRLKEKGA